MFWSRSHLPLKSAFALLLLAGCSPREEALPPELFRRWVTADGRYAGRYFEVTPSSTVIFGQGDGLTHGGKVTSVVRTPALAGGERCEIEYSDAEGADFDLVLQLSPDGESLVIGSSPEVLWRPREDQP